MAMTTDLNLGGQPVSTDIATYGNGAAGIIMTPDDARALDEQVRRCTAAVLREGTDYGIIPGTSGEKTLWRPGAQKLLQWFGYGFTLERIELERDDQGRKHGITYRAEVFRRLPDGTKDVRATCEGTADYDESKFHQTAEEVQRKAEYNERKWAKQYGRVADPTKWKTRGEYRADWNALMKRAQKRALVGAVNDATGAGGIFSDREEDDATAPQDDGPGWYEQALEAALTFTAKEDGQELWRQSATAARDGLCTPAQATHVQNRIRQRAGLLQAATAVDVEDLARQAQDAAAEDDTQEQAPDDPRAAGTADSRGAQPTPQLLGIIAQHFDRLGITERDERLEWTSKLAGRTLASSKDLTQDEARTVTGMLWKCDTLGDLTGLLSDGEKPGSDGDG